VFTKNRGRLMEGAETERLFEAVLCQARGQNLLSGEHFTVDGTLIRAWAHRDSFHPKDDPPNRGTGTDGELLLRDTHESSTDEEARLYKKSTTAERAACLAISEQLPRDGRAITLGADKQYQDPSFIAALRQRGVVPRVAESEEGQNVCKKSLLQEERDSEGLRVSQQKR